MVDHSGLPRDPRGERPSSADHPVRAAFDVEALWLADQLGLEVAEVAVQALERQGSKVRMLADALGMLGEVWAIRWRTNGAYDAGGEAPNPPSNEAAAGLSELPLTAATPSGMPPALQVS